MFEVNDFMTIDPTHSINDNPSIDNDPFAVPSHDPSPVQNPFQPNRPIIAKIDPDDMDTLVRRISDVVSIGGSGTSSSSCSADSSIVPHISSMFASLIEIKLSLHNLQHNINVIKGKAFNYGEIVDITKIFAKIFKLRNDLNSLLESVGMAGTEIATFRVQTEKAQSALASFSNIVSQCHSIS